MSNPLAARPIPTILAALLALPLLGCPAATGPADEDGDGYGEDEDCDDGDAAVHPGADELCDGLDNDCNGEVDDHAIDADAWYLDADGDAYGDPAAEELACAQPEHHVADDTDCDDTRDTVHPGADETCNELDDDCDGDVDEDPVDPETYYRDADLDGFGDAANTTEACDPPSGHVADDTDCDDGDAAVHPDAEEACNGVDDDCDGDVPADEADADGDQYRVCEDDCDDGDAAVNPGATEICNGVDDDCDGTIDVDADDATAWYADGDGDGYGAPGKPVMACDAPTGYVDDDTDCDDTAETGAACHDGCNDFYDDGDGDGYGDPATVANACSAPTGYLADDTDCDPASADHWHDCGLCVDADGDGHGTDCDLGPDCDDGDEWVHPGAEEICDGKDSDCDGSYSELGVDPAGTLDATTIMDAQAIHDGQERICVLPGTYVEDVDWDLGEVTLMSTFGPAVTTIEGTGAGPTLTLLQVGASTTIDGFTITGGDSSGVYTGGGVQIEDASPRLRNLVVTGNTGGYGGGICVWSGSHPQIEDTVVELNDAVHRAGGIYIGIDSSPTLSDVAVVDNYAAAHGGGLYIEGVGCDPTLEYVTVADNETGGIGGGMAIFAHGTYGNLIVDGNRTDLAANHYGGGIYVGEGDPVFQQVRVTDNQTSSGGGGFTISWDVDLVPAPELYNVIVAGNHAVAGNGAGMLLVHGVAPVLFNVSFVGNWAEEVGGVGGYGGGLFAWDYASPDLYNVDFSDNVADVDGGGLQIWDATTNLQIEFCNAWDNAPNAFADASGTLTDPFDPANPDGNLTEDPAYLWTSAPDASAWDLHLNSGSLLVDAGDTALYDPDISRSDIGAYGGFSADLWDLDHDGYPEWWQPGGYDGVTYPAMGLDCDDGDPDVIPGDGC